MSTKSTLQFTIGAGIVIAIAAAAAVLVPIPYTHAETIAQPAPQAMPAPVAEIHSKDITRWSRFSGRLEAVDRVEIRPRVAGAIESVHFREGELVKAGDLLFTIDPAPFETEVAKAEAQLYSAQSRLKLANSELKRGQELWKTRVITRSALDQREETRNNAEADVRSAKAYLRSAKLNLGYTQIRSPISGRVGEILLTPGNLVAAGANGDALTTVVSVDPIYASFDVNEEALARAVQGIRSHQSRKIGEIPVQLSNRFIGENPIVGHVHMIDNEFSNQSGTIRVQAVFDNPDGLLVPGQFARVELGQARQSTAILVSDRAIGTDQDKKFVLIVDKENKAEYRQIVPGEEQNGLRIVQSGLHDGDRVIVGGLQRIRPGALIAPQIVSMDGQPVVKTVAQGDTGS